MYTANRSRTKTTMTTDQSAFNILSTELHRIEQSSIQKQSCATVKNLRDSPCHTSNFVMRENLREKIAGVTSVLVTRRNRKTDESVVNEYAETICCRHDQFTKAVVTCETKIISNYFFSLRRRPPEIIISVHIETREIIPKRITAAHEHFPTRSMSLK